MLRIVRAKNIRNTQGTHGNELGSLSKPTISPKTKEIRKVKNKAWKHKSNITRYICKVIAALQQPSLLLDNARHSNGYFQPELSFSTRFWPLKNSYLDG